MAVMRENIADALGVTVPSGGSPQARQWDYWIAEANRIIERRATLLGVEASTLNADVVDSVVIRAVVAMVRNPDNATQVSVSVDDGTTSRTYKSGSGEVGLLDAWWAELGLSSPSDAGAYSVQATFEPDVVRPDLWWP